MEYYVYILKCNKTGKLYKGQTNNLERRLFEHKFDRYSSYELVFVQICDSRSEAIIWENFFKTGKGREIISELLMRQFGSIV